MSTIINFALVKQVVSIINVNDKQIALFKQPVSKSVGIGVPVSIAYDIASDESSSSASMVPCESSQFVILGDILNECEMNPHLLRDILPSSIIGVPASIIEDEITESDEEEVIEEVSVKKASAAWKGFKGKRGKGGVPDIGCYRTETRAEGSITYCYDGNLFAALDDIAGNELINIVPASSHNLKRFDRITVSPDTADHIVNHCEKWWVGDDGRVFAHIVRQEDKFEDLGTRLYYGQGISSFKRNGFDGGVFGLAESGDIIAPVYVFDIDPVTINRMVRFAPERLSKADVIEIDVLHKVDVRVAVEPLVLPLAA